jgi:hypothetical protein
MEYKANVLLQNMIRKKCNTLFKQTFSQDIKLKEQVLISYSRRYCRAAKHVLIIIPIYH